MPFIKKEDCMSCGQCEEICPQNAINPIRSGSGYAQYTIDNLKCIECGFCLKLDCPGGCILENQ